MEARWTWPLCDHCGSERLILTAGEHVAQLKQLEREAFRDWEPDLQELVVVLIRGVEKIAAQTAPDEPIGACLDCLCITTQSGLGHPTE